MKFISSPNNPEIKFVSSFLSNPGSGKYKNFLFLEGEKLVREAISSGLEPKNLFVQEDFFKEGDEQKWKHFENLCVLPRKMMQKITSLSSPPPIAALFLNLSNFSQEKILQNGDTFIFLDRIQDPGNIGTIIRSADAFRINGIFTSKGCCSISNPKVIRSAMGSAFRLPIIEVENFDDFATALVANKIELIACSINGDNIYATQFPPKIMLILGNEGSGIDKSIEDRCRFKLNIPMPGSAESLNVSIAASILLYERRRNFFQPKSVDIRKF